MCNDNLDDIVNKYNKTYHNTIKMNPVDIKSNTYIESSEKTNNKYPEFKIGDIVRISKYKNIFAKDYTPNWSEEDIAIKKVKFTVTWTYIIKDLNWEEIVRFFYENKLQKSNHKEFGNEEEKREKMLNGKDAKILLKVGLIKKT